jgi:hypothetical protein
MSTDVVDQGAVRQALAAARRLELSEARTLARQAVRPGAVGRLKVLSEDAATLYARTGQRGVMQTLALAENADEVRRAARLAASQGSRTRAILKVLGRGALVLGGVLGSLLGWSLAAMAWMVAVAMLARRLGLWLGRRLWPRRSRGVASERSSEKRPVPALPLAHPTQTAALLYGARRPLPRPALIAAVVGGGRGMGRQPGFFDVEEHLKRLSDLGDQPEAFARAASTSPWPRRP